MAAKRKPSAGRSARRRAQRKQAPVKKAQAAKGQGGAGGIQEDTRQTTRLLSRAVTQRWPGLDEDKRRAIMARLAIAALGGTDSRPANYRESTGAAKAIFQAEAQNMEQERRDLEIPDFHEHKVDAAIAVTEVVQLEGDEWYGRSPAPKANRPTKGA